MTGNVYLMGFMGSGKSAVGRALARRLKRRFVDLDAAVARRAGRSVPEIFASRGERAFRRLERAELLRAARLRRAVVALGGGALLDGRNRRALGGGMLVGLTCAEGQLWRRLRGKLGDRPLLAGGRDALRRLLRARRGLYRGAVLSVSTTRRAPAACAAAIADGLRARGHDL